MCDHQTQKFIDNVVGNVDFLANEYETLKQQLAERTLELKNANILTQKHLKQIQYLKLKLHDSHDISVSEDHDEAVNGGLVNKIKVLIAGTEVQEVEVGSPYAKSSSLNTGELTGLITGLEEITLQDMFGGYV